MKRYITLLDEGAGLQMVLPVTPAGYEWARRAAIEVVAVDRLGEVNLFGGKRLASAVLECLLPARAYPFLSPGASTDPWSYVEQLGRWADAGTVLRFLVSGTPVNEAVLLEEVSFREQDGTNDVYADITLRGYTRPETPVLPAQEASQPTASRDDATGASQARTYEVVRGDTMWDICRKFYGQGNLCWSLAAYNEVPNANLIYPGQVFQIPPRDQLPGAAARPESAQTAADTTTEYADGQWTITLPEGG